MKKTVFILLSLFLSISLQAQEQKNIEDLAFLFQEIQKTPSYKAQLKEDKEYQALYDSLRSNLNSNDDFEVYLQLLKLIIPLNDNHLGFYPKPDTTKKFNYLKPKLNLDSLVKLKQQKPFDSLEGIYTALSGKNNAVVYQVAPKEFHFLNLSTGVVEAIFFQKHANGYDVVRFLNSPVPYVLLRNTRFRNGRIDDLTYTKTKDPTFNELVKAKENFEYKILADDIGYLRLSSFSAQTSNLNQATTFFNSTKAKITTHNLIVDVRNNGGGAYKTSGQFIAFLNDYKGKVFILQNGYSVSNAEQFILTLKGKSHITTLGETTKGKITYGSNYGKVINLPSGRFVFYPTDMFGSKRDLAFEQTGVDPDIKLNPYHEDWITQTIKYIKSLKSND